MFGHRLELLGPITTVAKGSGRGEAFVAFILIPPCAAVWPPSGGSREKWVCTTSEREKTLTGVEYALHREIAVQPEKAADTTPFWSRSLRRNTMGAYITATGIAFGLLAIWAVLVPLVA
jgi:hypothetical protein